jgi:hypothetical protein
MASADVATPPVVELSNNSSAMEVDEPFLASKVSPSWPGALMFHCHVMYVRLSGDVWNGPLGNIMLVIAFLPHHSVCFLCRDVLYSAPMSVNDCECVARCDGEAC